MASPMPLDQLQPSSTPAYAAPRDPAGASTAPAFDPAPDAPQAAPPPGIVVPPEILQQMANSPLIKALQTGQPAAAYIKAGAIGGKEKLNESFDKLSVALPQLALAAYHSKKGEALVMYNPKAVTPEELAKADENGTLGHIAIPVGGAQHGHFPVNAAGDMPDDPAAAGAAAPGTLAAGLSQPPGAPLPAAAQAALARTRGSNASLQPPASSALPAQGIMNGLIKRAI